MLQVFGQLMARGLRSVVLVLLVLSVTVICVWNSGWIVAEFERETVSLELPPIALLNKVSYDGEQDFRLIFVGDVHGQYRELMNLIDNEAGGMDDETTVVLLGDVVSKGPDSEKVVSFILDHRENVKFVFGNHDLAMLFAYINPDLNYKPLDKIKDYLLPLTFSYSKELFVPRELSKVKKSHSLIAKNLGRNALKDFVLHGSAALEITLPTGDILYAVHAGMLPGDFTDRTPSVHSITEMKFIDPKDWTHTSKNKFPNAEKWYKTWDGAVQRQTTVLYGHDAKGGLKLRDRTKGLDSGCVKGGKLSALEYKYDHKSRKVSTRILQTDCVQSTSI